ncbi:hypothetical protein ACAW74_22675 [Fibrella sp. WM1]|uniref:hypothetical protein n=1 Tax=Fibrella musci TaxID=3242485 RepID=UPI0035200A9E
MTTSPASALSHLEIAQVGTGMPTTYLLKTPATSFYVRESVYRIIEGLRQGLTYAQISAQLQADGLNVPEQAVQELAETTLTRLNEPAPARPDVMANMQYVFGKITLLRPTRLPRLLRLLGHLFNPALMTVLVVSCLLATGLYFYQVTDTFISQHRSIWRGNEGIWLVVAYVIYFTVFMCHELGHASATRRFGLDPGDIGFGFYLIFPVFYADVSVIWALDRTRRIVVNLGGIYFQLLLNGLFVAVAYAFPATYLFLSPIIILNSLVMLYSLNPFLRYDGYWIYSDLFNLPNLRTQSRRYWATLKKRWGNVPVRQFVRPTEWPLFIYTVSSTVVLTVLAIVFVRVLYTSLVGVGVVFSYYGHWRLAEYHPDDLLTLARTLFLLIISGFFGHRLIKARRRPASVSSPV